MNIYIAIDYGERQSRVPQYNSFASGGKLNISVCRQISIGVPSSFILTASR